MSTAKKTSDKELRGQLEARNRFYREATHELCAPLQGIMGVVDSLLAGKSGRLTRAQTESLTLVHRAASGLTELANDLLELERLDLGPGVLEIIRFDPRQLISDVLPLAEALLEDSPVELEVNVRGRIPAIHCDVKGMQQVLMNLLGNAIKFTVEGHIHVNLRASGSFVRFEVEDTGIGIPPDETEAIFAQFHRIGGLVSPDLEGTGLGLSIAKRIVESHHGEIGVDSKAGEGSLFWFTIPTARSGLLKPIDRKARKGGTATSAHRRAESAPSLLEQFGGREGGHSLDSDTLAARESSFLAAARRGEGESVLVVDDTPINLAIVGDLLGDANYRVLTAPSGPAALEILEQHQVDLVITDLWMAGMNGFELIERIRASESHALVPVVILSARRYKSDIIYGLNLGADDFIPKPFLPEELLARVKGLMRLRQAHKELRAFNRALEEKVEKRTRELTEVREHLLLSERMSSIGQLTAGIAHEINNPIGYSLSNIDLLSNELPMLLRRGVACEARSELDQLGPRTSPRPLIRRALTILRRDRRLKDDVAEFVRLSEGLSGKKLANEFRTFLDYIESLKDDSAVRLHEVNELLAACRDGLSRVRDIVLELSAFARPKRDGATDGFDLSVCVDRALAIAGNALRAKNIQIRRRSSLKKPVSGDPAKIEQVVLNLVLNAVHVLDVGGELAISTREKAGAALLEVRDDGPGIPKEHRDHIFNPFFTTKKVGEGTGLGLSICYRIIEDHGGKISFESHEGSGTTFRITLPIARKGHSGDVS